MKKIVAIVLAIIISLSASWREGEKEILINKVDKRFVELFNQNKLNGEFGNGKARVFVTDKEQELLDNSDIEYSVVIENLNDHYQGFWESDVPTGYYTFEKIKSLSDSLATNFPDICKKYVFGTSVNGEEIGALKITDNPDLDEIEPEVMFDGGIHGDEIGASENCIRFARDLVQKYGVEDEITELIDNREIWIYYCVNPDGRINMERTNANGVDLNRDWGYMWDEWGGSTGAYSQPESKALRDCAYNKSFVVHTTYHSGIEYISLPWSYRSDVCPDFDQIYDLGGIYSSSSTYANMEYGQGNTGMYAINGSTKDTNYGGFGAISWSMEISTDKQPPASQLMPYYQKNYPAMLAMVEHSGYGISGQILDSETNQPVKGAIFINDYLPCYSDLNNGDFHKYLLPGTYSITVKANGYEEKTVEGVVVNAEESTFNEILLTPKENSHYAYKFSSSQIAGNNPGDPGDTAAIIGEPDQRFYSIGKNGWMVFDMLEVVEDGAGPDLTVFEGDDSPESFELFAGETMDGDWVSLGNGTGTSHFDLADGSITSARYFKIVDDGDGSNGLGAGFDFDAAQALPQTPGPYINLINFTIDDSAGNNDGRVDPGEDITINYTLKNSGDQIAEDVELEIQPNEHMSINPLNYSLSNIGAGEEYNGSFDVSVSEYTPSGYLSILDLQITSGDLTFESFISYKVGGYIIEENFDTFPGDGWSKEGGNWVSSTTNESGGESPEAKFGWQPSTVATQYMISPIINTSGMADGVKLVYSYALDHYESGDPYEIGLATSSDGENWNIIKQLPVVDTDATTDSLEINSEISPDYGSTEFRFAFRFDGNSYDTNNWYVDDVYLSKIQSVSLDENLVENLVLEQNYPNPFNPTTTLSFVLPSAGEINLSVFNTKGELVKTVLNNNLEAGSHSITFDGENLSSGVYYYKLKSANRSITRKMILVK